MKYFIVVLFIIMTCFSCRSKSNDKQPAVNDSTGNPVTYNSKDNFSTGTKFFIEIDSSGILMFPLSTGDTKTNNSYYRKSSSDNYWNIIFYNSNTGEHHFLSERKMLIENLNYQYFGSGAERNGTSATKNYLFFKIAVSDYNGDNELTDADPQYLFITDKVGKNFRQISPDNCNLISWKCIKASNKVIMTVTTDSDNNKKFNEKDMTTSYEVKMDSTLSPRETFTKNFRKKINDLYTRDQQLGKIN